MALRRDAREHAVGSAGHTNTTTHPPTHTNKLPHTPTPTHTPHPPSPGPQACQSLHLDGNEDSFRNFLRCDGVGWWRDPAWDRRDPAKHVAWDPETLLLTEVPEKHKHPSTDGEAHEGAAGEAAFITAAKETKKEETPEAVPPLELVGPVVLSLDGHIDAVSATPMVQP